MFQLQLSRKKYLHHSSIHLSIVTFFSKIATRQTLCGNTLYSTLEILNLQFFSFSSAQRGRKEKFNSRRWFQGLYKQTDNGCYCLSGMKRTGGTAVSVDIYTAVTDCRDRISRAKNRALRKSAGPRSWLRGMCIRMHSPLPWTHEPAYIYPRPRDETAQWQLSRCSPMQWKRQREGPRLYPRHRPPPLLFSLLVRTDVLLSHRLQLGNLYNNRPSWFSSHHYFEGVLEFEGILRGLRKFDDGILNGKSDYYVLILSIYIYIAVLCIILG